MRTNLNKTNLTLRKTLSLPTLRAVLFVLLIAFGVGNAWASGGTTYYYTKGSVSVKTGSGTVYINTASPATSGSSTTSSTAATKSCDKTSTQNQEQTYYISAVPATDWRFDSWTLSNWSTNPSSNTATTSGKIKAASSTESSPSTATAQATFKQISIASANKTSVTLNPTDARTSCNDYTGTVVFTTTNDNASSQIGTPSFGSKSGSGTWEATNSWAAGTSTVTYTFKGNGYYGGSGTASGSRNNSATLTLPTAGGTSSKSVTFTANFPALVIADGETDVVSPKGPTDDGDGAVTFDVTYFDGLFDIANVVISEETGGTWTLGSMSYEQTNAATGAGVVTVPFTFNAGGATGDFSAKLTLTPATNTEASAKEVTLSAHVDDLSTNDASVTPLGGSTTEYATFAEALAAANDADGCTIKLLRDIEGITTSQEVKKTMTLDLNRYSLSGTLSSAGGLLKLNTAGKVLTITDTQAGGSISVSGNIDGRIAAVEVLKGSLVLEKGDLLAQNANTGTTLANIYAAGAYLDAGTTMAMTGGSVTANRTGASGNYCFGIYCAGTGSSASSVTLTGGSVTATFPNGSYAEGVFAAGNSIISNMTVTASSKTTCYAIRVEDGHLVVNGGIFTATTTNQEARGLYSMNAPSNKNAVVVNNATFNVTAGTTDARGIWCRSTTTTMTGDPTDANVMLSGVTVNAKTDETTGTTDAYAIMSDAGVCLGIQSGTYTATTKTQNTYALHTSGYTAVVDGTFNANSTTRTAFAIYVNGGITAVKAGTFTASAATAEVHATKILANAKLLTYGGTFRGICTNVASDGWATGSQVMSTGTLEAQGGTFIGEINKAELTAAQTGCACGIYANTGSIVTLSNATLKAKANNKWLNGGATTTYYGTHGLLTKTTNRLTLTNCTISATSAYQYAYGIRALDTPVEIKNCTVSVDTDYPYNYGIYTYGAANVEASNSTFTCISQQTYAYGSYVANGTLTATDCKFTVKTLQNNVTSAANNYLRGIYVAAGKKATLNGCTIDAQGNSSVGKEGYGIYVDGSADVDNCTVTVSNINAGAYAIYNSANTSMIGIASGKFKATATSTAVSTNGTAAAAKQQLYGGFYNTNNNLEKYLPEGYGIEILSSGSTEYGEGYRYAIRPSTNLNPVCKIGSTPYYTLEEALEFVNKNSGTEYTILMTADYTLPAGDYALPAKATLLVPKKDQTTLESHPSRVAGGTAWATPTCNRKLTFAANAHLVVLGKIQTGGVQAAVNQMPGHNGVPRDTYGHIVLNAGSTITLESGSHLYSWGYVTGAGTIDAKRGSTVHENLQIRDWRGGTCTSSMNGNNNKVFPLNQYAIQNIESAITFHPGSAEKCDGTVNARTSLFNSTPKAYTFEDVNLIGVTGSGSLFMMDNEDNSADTWVRKYYDVANDMQVYELNSSANLGSLSLSLYGISFNSVSYVLPLTNNMHIHLLTGTMHITQDTEVLPGAIIEIDKEATAYVDKDKSLYIFDADEWDKFGTGTSYFYLLAYSATLGKAPTARSESTKPADATFNLHGKLEVEGKLYTTSSGANICSTNEDAGRVHFVNAAPSTTTTVYVANNTGPTYNGKTADPARLKNGDGTYEPTSGTVAGKTWIYTDDKWKCWEVDGCFIRDAQNNPYAHPSDYVRLTNDEPDANHLYKAYESDRYFIWDASCQWWEIDPSLIAAGEYKAIKADHNGKYNYYEYDSTNKYWKIKKVTITWKNGSTTLGTYTNVGYKTHPKYLEATPKIDATSTEYYTWLGWTMGSEDGEFFAKDAELPFATENTTYYALFETHKYSYAVVFKNYDGSILQTSPWEAGQVPYYLAETDPVKPATAAKVYTFTGWSPAFTAVTGTGQVYTAQFDAGTDRTYTVQWVNYNGTVLKEEQVVYGTSPSAPATPTRPNDTYYTYTFNEWTPAPSAVTGNQTYTATYNYEKKVTKYDIKFNNGSTTLYTQSLPNGETPVYGGSTPTKDDEQYTYTFDGWSATDGGDKLTSLPAVSGATTYYAVFTKELKTYTIRWKSIDDKQTYETDNNVQYGATPSYDGATPTKARQGATVFTFDGWSAVKGGDKIALPTVTGHATYYAHFSDDPVYTVTFNANGHGTSPANQEIVSGGKVTQPSAPSETGWTFGGWYKEPACTNAWNFSSDVVTANTTLYAKWTIITYTITWLNDDNTQIDQTQVAYGEVPTHANPTKAPTAEYSYSFNSWDPELEAAMGNATYKATYVSTKNYYTITWLNDDNTQIDETSVAYGEVPTHAEPTKAPTDGYTYTFSSWDHELAAVTGDATYIATYTSSPRVYPVLWKDYDGNTLGSSQRTYGEPAPYASDFSGLLPTRPSKNGKVYTFSGWSDPVSVVDGCDVTYTALYRVDLLAEESSGPVEIDTDIEVETTTVRVSGHLSIAPGAKLTTTDLILEASSDASGEITGAVEATNVYFDYAVESDGRHWNVFGVPFEIGDLDAVKLQYKNARESSWHPMILGTHYDITYYDEATRAAQGPVHDCWKYVEDKPAGQRTLQPGIAYSIAFLNHIDTLRFTKASGSPIEYVSDVEMTNTNTGDGSNGGWNGIANPKTYHALLATGVTLVQIHDGGEIGKDCYDPWPIANYKFVVGRAGYVQIDAASSVLSVTQAGDQSPIPAHIAARYTIANETSELYTVEFNAEGTQTDRVYVRTEDDKSDEYTVGSDVMKMSVSSVRPQLWVDRYNMKLCMNTVAPIDGQAAYPLGLYAPAAGEYTIALQPTEDDTNTIYLTCDGLVIWNLTYSPYLVQLEKGTNTRYGLQIVHTEAPAITTGVGEAPAGTQPTAQKVLLNDKVYILRGTNVYTVEGQMVK